MAHETVKIELEASYPYSDFMGWYESMTKQEKDEWVQLAKEPNRSESGETLLTKKAMELYCLEMDIDYIPNSENYLDLIYRRLISNLVIASLIEKGLVFIGSGKLSFIGDADILLTEKGKIYLKKPE